MKDQILKIVTREAEKVVAPETRIEALGLDSLEFLDLITAIEQECAVALSEDAFDELSTVGDLIRIAEASKIHA